MTFIFACVIAAAITLDSATADCSWYTRNQTSNPDGILNSWVTSFLDCQNECLATQSACAYGFDWHADALDGQQCWISTSWTSNPANVFTAHYQWNCNTGGAIGCYKDMAGDPDLTNLVFTNSFLYQNVCSGICFLKGFRFASLQRVGASSNTACYCGNVFGKYGPSTQCTWFCSGSYSNTLCGGTMANLVLDTGLNMILPKVFPFGCYYEAGYFVSSGTAFYQAPCASICKNIGATYAAITNVLCYCGWSFYGRYTETSTYCEYTCSSDSSASCGGAGTTGWTVIDTDLDSNVALDMTTYSSSWNPSSGNLNVTVDGMKDTQYCNGPNSFCTSTETNPWMAIDLGTTQNVSFVNIVSDTNIHTGGTLTITSQYTFLYYLEGNGIATVSNAQVGIYAIPPTVSMVAIIAQSSASNVQASLLASTKDGWLMTDARWKCSAVVAGNAWKTPAFDDSSWPYAVELGSNDGLFRTKVPNIPSRAKWISVSTFATTINCRAYFGSKQMTIAGEYFSLSIDGNFLGDFSTPYRFNVAPTAGVLTIGAKTSVANARAKFLVSTTDIAIMTISSWRCEPYSNPPFSDPWTQNYYDAFWRNAIGLGSNDGSYVTQVQGINSSARWITSATSTTWVICRLHFGKRLHDFKIGVTDISPLLSPPNITSSQLCGSYTGDVISGTYANVSCTPNTNLGRYVIIQISGTNETLCMCEVEVYVWNTGAIRDANVALQRTTFQSSMFVSGIYLRSTYAVDGWVNTSICATTNADLNPWWTVDLGRTIYVRRVDITTPAGSNGIFLHDFIVNISDTSLNGVNLATSFVFPVQNSICAYFPGRAPNSTTISLNCSTSSLPGRYVAIIMPFISGQLVLCEVGVYVNLNRIPLQNPASPKACTWIPTISKYNSGGIVQSNVYSLLRCLMACLASTLSCNYGFDWVSGAAFGQSCFFSSDSTLSNHLTSTHYDWTCYKTPVQAPPFNQAVSGCYSDNKNARDLPTFISTSPSMNRNVCSSACFQKAYRYAGVQIDENNLGIACYCGNIYGQYGPSGNCTLPCPGMSGNLTCGGILTNSIIDTGLKSVIPNYIPVGCYYDVNRYIFNSTSIADQSSCVQKCIGVGALYAGIGNQVSCYCGWSYGNHSTSTICDKSCTSESSATCGGTMGWTLIDTGLNPTSNSALGQKLISSSIDPTRGDTHAAVDGIKSSCSGAYSTCTKQQLNPWMVVDLGSTKYISLVNILTDTNTNNFSPLTITSANRFIVSFDGIQPTNGDISGGLTGTYTLSPSTYVMSVYSYSPTSPQLGRILVSSPNGYVSSNAWKCVSAIVANWDSPTFDDSMWPSAIELGVNNGTYTTAVPGISSNAKWITASIANWQIWCRGYFGPNLRNFQIGISDVSPLLLPPTPGSYLNCGSHSGVVPKGTTVNVTCATNMSPARYVIIQALGVSESFCACEIEVFTRQTGTPPDINFALGRSTYQSSTANSSSYAVDGWPTSLVCASTTLEFNPWWAVDIGRVLYIRRVDVSSSDAITTLADFLINITTSNPSLIVTRPTPFSFIGLNSLCAIYPGVAPPSTSLTCRTDISPGRFVVVLVPFATKRLALCEVAVFANLTYIPNQNGTTMIPTGCTWNVTTGISTPAGRIQSSITSIIQCMVYCLESRLCAKYGFDWIQTALTGHQCIISISRLSTSSVLSNHYAWTCTIVFPDPPMPNEMPFTRKISNNYLLDVIRDVVDNPSCLSKFCALAGVHKSHNRFNFRHRNSTGCFCELLQTTEDPWEAVPRRGETGASYWEAEINLDY